MADEKRIVTVVQGFINGKKIVCRQKGCRDWLPVDKPLWDFNFYDYKIAEREFWVNVYASWAAKHDFKKDADRCAGTNRLECIHVKEIL